MSTLLTLRSRWLQYGMDIVLVLLLSIWIFAPVNENQYLAIFSLMVVGGVLYEILFRRITVTVGKVVFTFPVLFGIGWLLGIDLLVLMMLILFIGWRFTSHYFDEDLGQEVHIFLLSLVSTIAFYFFFSTNDYVPFVFSLVFLQTVLFAIIRVRRTLFNKSSSKGVSLWLGRFTIGVMVATASILLLFPLIKSVIMNILKGIGATFAFIFYYPLSYIFKLFEGLVKEENLERAQEDVESSDEKTNEEILKEMVNDSNQSEWFTYALVAIIVIAVFWYGIRLYKRKLSFDNLGIYRGLQESSRFLGEDFREQSLGENSRPPTNKIRKKLLWLEKKMANYSFGRYPQESALEWFNRIGIPSELSANVNQVYEQARYGKHEISVEVEEKYIQSIKQLVIWGKEQHKIKKKEQKKKGRLDF